MDERFFTIPNVRIGQLSDTTLAYVDRLTQSQFTDWVVKFNDGYLVDTSGWRDFDLPADLYNICQHADAAGHEFVLFSYEGADWDEWTKPMEGE